MPRNGKDSLRKGTADPTDERIASESIDWQAALIDLSYEPIFAWEWEKGIIEWNAGAEKQYGFKRAEVLGKNSHELLATIPPVPLRRFLKKLEAERHWVGELRHTTKDGSELIVESRQQLIVRGGHRIVVESNRDITVRREGEGQVAFLIVIGELINEISDPSDLLFAASKVVGEYFKARRCLFNEIDLERDLEIVHRDYCRGVPSVAGTHKLSPYSPITFAEMKAGRTVVNSDSKADPRTAKLYKKTYEPAGERAYVAVPLMRDGQWKASLWVSDDEPRDWSQGEITLLEIAAERIWLAVEKRRSEAALRESESRFRHIADCAPVMIWISDPSKKCLWFNKPWLEFTGRTIEQESGEGWMEGVYKEDLDRFVNTNVKAFDARRGLEVEYRLRRYDGEYRWILDRGAPRITPSGEFLGYIGSCIDITERKRMEEALRESEGSYRVLAESASDAIIRIDEESIVSFVNSAATRIFGYTEEEMIGRSLTMLMPEELHRQHRTGFVRYLKTGVRKLNWESVHVPARHKDGHYFPVEMSFGEYNRGGKRFFIGIARDATERKKAEGLLDRYRMLSEKSGDSIWFTRLDGSFVDINQAAVESYGYTRDEFLSMNVRDLRNPSALGEFQKQLNAAKSGGVHFETVHMRKDGTQVPVDVRANSSDFGGEHLIMAVVRDITERKLADDALRKSEELFSRFMQHLPGIAWIKDANGRYIYANDAAEKAFRTSRKELYGKSDDQVFPPEIAGQFEENDRRALERGAGLQTIETLMQDDGVHHSIVSKFPISDADGRTGLIGGMAIDITDRVKAEEALRESEDRRQLAQEAGNVGIFDWDILAGRTYWSETMWSFYGEEPRDINPDEAFWSAHLHENDRERVKRNIRRVVRSDGDEFRDEFRVVRSDGSIAWIEARAKISRSVSGKAMRMYGVNTDITQRKESEEKVRLSDNQLRLVTNAVPALISYIDKDEKYRFANERFTDWFGISTDDMIGKKPREVFGAEAYRILKPYVNAVLSGEKCTFETVLRFKDLGDRYVHASYIPDVGADGTVYGYYGLTHDLTDLRHSEDLLRSSEERIGLMMESLTDYAIFSLDGKGIMDSWNKGAETIFGYAQAEILGRSHELLFTPEDVADVVPAKEMRTALRKNRASTERWLLRKDGGRFFAHGVMMPLYVGKTLTGYAKIVSDLTEKKRHAEELQRAHDQLESRVKERTKELAESNSALVHEMQERKIAEDQRIDLLRRLVSSQEFERRRIARDLHDQMGQRLTALRLKIASLHEISPGDERFASRVDRLQEIAQHLDSEVSFLAWELRPTTLDDLGLLDAAAAFVDEWSRHYEISADFHSTGLFKERLDREVETHLYRITQEALNNIAKHAEAEHVTVLLERREQSVILIIEDNGKGFDTNKKHNPGESGRGLGLVGMGERAGLIGGEIEIESAYGKGTTIYVRVPFF